jgi:hypothetical protein
LVAETDCRAARLAARPLLGATASIFHRKGGVAGLRDPLLHHDFGT